MMKIEMPTFTMNDTDGNLMPSAMIWPPKKRLSRSRRRRSAKQTVGRSFALQRPTVTSAPSLPAAGRWVNYFSRRKTPCVTRGRA